MSSNSMLSLNEKSIQANVKFLKKELGKTVILSAVVKANAYGHGIENTVPLFEKNQIHHFSVFDYSEAIRVYKSLSKPRAIMIMGWIDDKELADTILKGIEFYVFNFERLELALKFSKQVKQKAKIHLEAETGMNRSGLNQKELQQAVEFIVINKNHFDICGFCTHLAGAESISNHTRIQKQLKTFHKLTAILESNKIKPKLKHVANSAASFVYPNSRLDLVRIGIMLYGFWSSNEVYIQYINTKSVKTDPLYRVLDWKSQVMSLKHVKIGEFVGYGISYLAQSDILTALVPVGYSAGYSRSLSNKGRLLINGYRCSVIGLVNMNMIVVDVTKVPNVKVGDEVVIIGKQKDLEIKVSAFSDISEQLNYEVLTHLTESIERIVIDK